jgi:purine-binding chemotaxis protein CheW
MSSSPQQAQFLSFMLGQETFAIGILAVREILEYAGVTPVPHLPPAIRGVINLRGAALPVLDLACQLGRQPAPIGKRTCIIVVEVEGAHGAMVLGMLVDAVNAVLDIGAADIEPPPRLGAVRADFLHGIGKVNERFVLLLDLPHVVDALQLQDMAASHAAPATADS